MNPNRSLLSIASMIAALLIFSWPGSAAALTDIELLGKNIFFDKISKPEDQQSCASCHDGAKGGTLPNSAINQTTVVAPGSQPKRLGSLKVPTNAYASFSPPFRSFNPGPVPIPPWEGGNFWDGRAEGCRATQADVPGTRCPSASPAGNVSETITLADLPTSKQILYENISGLPRIRL